MSSVLDTIALSIASSIESASVSNLRALNELLDTYTTSHITHGNRTKSNFHENRRNGSTSTRY